MNIFVPNFAQRMLVWMSYELQRISRKKYCKCQYSRMSCTFDYTLTIYSYLEYELYNELTLSALKYNNESTIPCKTGTRKFIKLDSMILDHTWLAENHPTMCQTVQISVTQMFGRLSANYIAQSINNACKNRRIILKCIMLNSLHPSRSLYWPETGRIVRLNTQCRDWANIIRHVWPIMNYKSLTEVLPSRDHDIEQYSTDC